jgi:hypothetical protein
MWLINRLEQSTKRPFDRRFFLKGSSLGYAFLYIGRAFVALLIGVADISFSTLINMNAMLVQVKNLSVCDPPEPPPPPPNV